MKPQTKKDLTWDDLMWNLSVYLLKKQSFPADPYLFQHKQSIQNSIKKDRDVNTRYVDVTQKTNNFI